MQPRPDQRRTPAPASAPGSRSGAGDIAGALGYPGVPAAVPNLLSQRVRRVPTGSYTLVTFTAPGRIWAVIMSYFILTDNSYSGTSNTFAEVDTSISGLTGGVIDLGASAPDQGFGGQSNLWFGGVPVVQGETVTLNVNNSTVVPGIIQRCSAVVLYSIP